MEVFFLSKVITFGNFKGGTGKTTNSCMIGNELANRGFKTLVVDMDPQANASSMYLLTKQRRELETYQFKTTLMTAISNGSIKGVEVKIKDNLYLLPSFADFSTYPFFLEKKFKRDIKKRAEYFSELLNEVKVEYDYILIDVPPTISVTTDSALLSSDFALIVMQTHERSLQGAETFVRYLQELVDNYDADFDVLGILPVLLKNNAPVDLATLENAKNIFGEDNLFDNVVKNMERLKRYDIIGIVDPESDEADMHDRRVRKLYKDVTDEFIKRSVINE